MLDAILVEGNLIYLLLQVKGHNRDRQKNEIDQIAFD
jgi:hypothetical protein